jgi:hypothetical protein
MRTSRPSAVPPPPATLSVVWTAKNDLVVSGNPVPVPSVPRSIKPSMSCGVGVAVIARISRWERPTNCVLASALTLPST